MPDLVLDDTKPLCGARARIRMYRVGLGDCFLLSVTEKGTIRHVLIDCGMFAGSRLVKSGNEKALQNEVVRHIASETGEKLDAVVVTHEHMDHVSIFNSARQVFQGFKVREAWFGWMEEDTPANRELRGKYEVMETHLAAALSALAAMPEAEKAPYRRLHEGVAGVAEFLGMDGDGKHLTEDGESAAVGEAGALGAVKQVKKQPRAAIDFVKGMTKKHRYGCPGDIWDFAGLKVHVLGPPPMEKQLRVLERAGATYDTALGVLGATDDGSAGGSGSPFGEQWRQPVQGSGAKLALDDSVVEEGMKRMLDRYLDPRDAWRRIDLQALDSTPTLALQMDNYVNNTSLALAFELPPKQGEECGDVLLFPGDAQVGNWEWWFKIEKFDVKKLLARTILYKVGHHGSHNATLKAALDCMNHPHLVAMMPTNQAFARDSKQWSMPAKNLRTELLKHARKRVLRNDQGMPGADDPMNEGEWGELKNNVKVEDLFIDYYV